jgi:hypothetical protein
VDAKALDEATLLLMERVQVQKYKYSCIFLAQEHKY